MIYVWDPQLSDREIHFIGMIFIQWSSLEHLVFNQTLVTYAAEGKIADELPKEMNNIQFTAVLDLWKERVVSKAKVRRAKVLLQQYNAILELKDARDALAHGMWNWSPEDSGQICTVRVKKREVIFSHFSASALEEIARKIGEINFKIRFPAGILDLAKERAKVGGFISRRAMALFTGEPTGQDNYPINESDNCLTVSARRADER